MTHYEISDRIKEFLLAQQEELSWFLGELSEEYKIGDRFVSSLDKLTWEIKSYCLGHYQDRIFYNLETDEGTKLAIDAEMIKQFMEKVNEHAKAH